MMMAGSASWKNELLYRLRASINGVCGHRGYEKKRNSHDKRVDCCNIYIYIYKSIKPLIISVQRVKKLLYNKY